jgi:hypothetical protein
MTLLSIPWGKDNTCKRCMEGLQLTMVAALPDDRTNPSQQTHRGTMPNLSWQLIQYVGRF